MLVSHVYTHARTNSLWIFSSLLTPQDGVMSPTILSAKSCTNAILMHLMCVHVCVCVYVCVLCVCVCCVCVCVCAHAFVCVHIYVSVYIYSVCVLKA